MEIQRITNQRRAGDSTHNYASFPIHHFVVRSMLKYFIAREDSQKFTSYVSLYGRWIYPHVYVWVVSNLLLLLLTSPPLHSPGLNPTASLAAWQLFGQNPCSNASCLITHSPIIVPVAFSNDLLFYVRQDESLYKLQWLPVLVCSKLPILSPSELMLAPARREGR